MALCDDAGLDAKIIPGLFEIVGGTVDLNRIRPVAVEDLLGRDPVELDTAALHDLVGDKVVLVTGAGGSIGSELVRQAARYEPSSLVLFEGSEPALWAIDREIRAAHPGCRLWRASVTSLMQPACARSSPSTTRRWPCTQQRTSMCR